MLLASVVIFSTQYGCVSDTCDGQKGELGERKIATFPNRMCFVAFISLGQL